MILNISEKRGLTLQPSKRQARYFHYRINKKIMKYAYVYTLFLVFVFHTSCGQNQTNAPKDNASSDAKGIITPDGPTTSVRTIVQDRKGNIWLASNEGIIRYD